MCERCAARRSPGRHAEVLLDEVAGDRQRQQGDEKDGRDVANDAQGGDAQQRGAAEALQGGGDVLVDGVGVGGEPVEDAAQRGGLEQPGGEERLCGSSDTKQSHFPFTSGGTTVLTVWIFVLKKKVKY